MASETELTKTVFDDIGPNNSYNRDQALVF